jgi:DNA repair exonuclease SbcCD nuclease subunit
MVGEDEELGDMARTGFFKNFKYVCSGHYHVKTHRDNVTYVGSIMDFRWGEEFSEHGVHVIDENGSLRFVKVIDNIHRKFFISSREDLREAVESCKGLDVKLVMMKGTKITSNEYDYCISMIDSTSQSLQIYLAGEEVVEDVQSDFDTKTFEEFIIKYFEGKNYGSDIDKEKLQKIFLQLYKITSKE